MDSERNKSVKSILANSSLKKIIVGLSLITLAVFGAKAQQANDKPKAKTEETNKIAVPVSAIVEGSAGVAEGFSMRNPDFFVISLHGYQENDPYRQWSKSTKEYAEELYRAMTDTNSPYRIKPEKIKIFIYEVASLGYSASEVQLDADVLSYGKTERFHPLDMIKNARYFQKAYYKKHNIGMSLASSNDDGQLKQRELQ